MQTTLQSNILQLARAEHDTCQSPAFIRALSGCPSDEQSKRIVLAADRLIGYLFTYGLQFITLGEQYYQPCLEEYPHYVMYNWRMRKTFCKGCVNQEWGCQASPFSSSCLRFRVAHAVNHTIAVTNLLLGGKDVHTR